MEGDAGTSRLNPIDEDNSPGTEVTDGDSTESESVTDPTDSDVKDDDSKESAADAESTAQEPEEAEESEESEESEEVASPEAGRPPSRLAGAWLAGIAALLLIFAGAVGFGGYWALHTNQDVQALQRSNATALNIAKECVAATQAPDTASMAASEQKIVDCGTDQYRTQALLYSSMLVQAYQAANVHLKVSDMRAAIERNNPDGSVDVLIALRINLSNDQQQNSETGYRLRVRMAPTDGTYKISKLDQVTK